jgi:hypothetical protein
MEPARKHAQAEEVGMRKTNLFFPLVLAAVWVVLTALALREMALLAGATASARPAPRAHTSASAHRPAIRAELQAGFSAL